MARGGRGGGFSGGRGLSGGGMRGSSGRGSFGAGRGGSPLGGRPMAPRPAAPRPAGGMGGFWGGFGLGSMMGRRSMWGFGPRVIHHHHGGPAGGPGGQGGRQGGSGCVILAILLLVIVVLTIVVSNMNSSAQITRSTVQRTPLPAGSAIETPFYTDQLGWIRSSSVMIDGLHNFYTRTGVRPHVYITDTVAGTRTPTRADMENYALQLYDELFSDEAHLLLLFHEYPIGDFRTQIITGVQANSVMDNEARDILLDYIDRYYFYDQLSEEQFFARSFNDASVRIMTVTTSPWIPIMGGFIALGVAGLAFVWWRTAKEKKLREMEEARQILSTPLQEFGSPDTGLEDKYKN